jgi:4-phospho-D-threonate 3-dehydrogenase / 4-phospho-D-erythronate 3-dehydrogenase
MEAESVKPLLAVTVGDVAGIGPEIVAKALSRPALYERCRPLVVGDAAIIKDALRFTGSNDMRVNVVDDPARGAYAPSTVDVFQPAGPVPDVVPGQLSPAAGRAAVEYVQAAVELARCGVADAIVTAPLNKEAMHAAGFTYPGHTEILAESFDAKRYSLVLTAQGLFVFHVTTHVSLREALDRITRDRVLDTVQLAGQFARARGQESEPIAVSGLNPHAGEGGVFGNEEALEIAPAIADAVARGIPAIGPLPADALWPAAVNGKYRFIVVMYHDQGHAPFKSMYGDSGVNITVGLPVVRTSVDHGTAFDIAGTGIAREESLLHAIDLAIELAPSWARVWRSISDESV